MRVALITKLLRVWFIWAYLGFVQTGSGTGAPPTRDYGGPVPLSNAERAWLQKHPAVSWGADPQWPPFSSLDEQGRISGIDVDIVRLIARRTGLELKFIKTRNWSETLRKASTGDIDFVGGIARTEERERLLGLRFTEVFCNFPTAIVTRKEMPFLTSMRALRSKLVALPRDYATTEELRRRYPGTQVLLTENEEQSMLAVAANKADATVLNLASAGYIVHMRGLANLKISGFTEIDFFLSLAVKSDSPELRSILEKGIASIGSKEKEAIFANYITPGTLDEIDWQLWRRRLIYSALLGTVVLAGVLAWNRGLALQIRRRKIAETSLRQATDRLEERGRQLDLHAQRMEILNRRLTSANEDLEAFSYSVSHDLKGPLRRVRSFADLIELNEKDLDSDTRRSIKGIQLESQRMNELIEALLALARVGIAELHLAQVNLGELTREVIGELQVETQGRQLRWEILPLPSAECDRLLLRQVIVNLLTNAVKFTRGRSPALIQIGALPQKTDDTEIVFFVKDIGAGFEKDQAGTLFETFRRLHRYEEYEGSGIGLTILKRIIQKHGGRVWAEGRINQGATFYFSLVKDPTKH